MSATVPNRGQPSRVEARLGGRVDPWAAELCIRALVAQATGAEDSDVRAFLYGPDGDAFLDGVAAVLANGAELRLAVGATVARWMAFDVDPGTARAIGVPPGLPLLVGAVRKAAMAHAFEPLEAREIA